MSKDTAARTAPSPRLPHTAPDADEPHTTHSKQKKTLYVDGTRLVPSLALIALAEPKPPSSPGPIGPTRATVTFFQKPHTYNCTS